MVPKSIRDAHDAEERKEQDEKEEKGRQRKRVPEGCEEEGEEDAMLGSVICDSSHSDSTAINLSGRSPRFATDVASGLSGFEGAKQGASGLGAPERQQQHPRRQPGASVGAMVQSRVCALDLSDNPVGLRGAKVWGTGVQVWSSGSRVQKEQPVGCKYLGLGLGNTTQWGSGAQMFAMVWGSGFKRVTSVQ